MEPPKAATMKKPVLTEEQLRTRAKNTNALTMTTFFMAFGEQVRTSDHALHHSPPPTGLRPARGAQPLPRLPTDAPSAHSNSPLLS
jgi:hypothetical protein